jgi:2-amino-4-hydroxy-6-hydroxymethyldihydropteridine diphosphokinase
MTPTIEKRERKHVKETTIAYIGLGSNLGDREATLRAALAQLGELPQTKVAAVSGLIETDPVGVVDQPQFVNAVARLETALEPRALLDAMLSIERDLGRDREHAQRWGPRTIDLDLLLFGRRQIDEPGLSVPHPRLLERAFVVEPLREVMLDDELEVPGQGRLRRRG